MNKRAQVVGLLTPLLLVEAASYWKLSRWLQWGSDPWLAFATALAFIGLMLGSIVALSLDIPSAMRRHVFVGGLWLFAVQALANVLIVYTYGLSAVPVDVVVRFFGVDAEAAYKVTAVVQGASLSVVSISFWGVLAQLLRSHWDEQREQRARLRNLESLIEKEATQ